MTHPSACVPPACVAQGLNDLGDFLHQRGDLEGALKSYVRSRDYCHITRHNVDMCLNVIKVRHLASVLTKKGLQCAASVSKSIGLHSSGTHPLIPWP